MSLCPMALKVALKWAKMFGNVDLLAMAVVSMKGVNTVLIFRNLRDEFSIKITHDCALDFRCIKDFFDRITGLAGRLNAG
jgi:hypothetical protein